MNAASHVPSGILMVTSVSTTGVAAANAGGVATSTPAATDRAMKSRRAGSATDSGALSDSCVCFVIAVASLSSSASTSF
jgi:hypothetical protein